MKTISKQLIESIAEMDNSEFVNDVEEKINSLVYLAVDDMSKSIPYVDVDKCVLQPVNEIFNGAITPESEFVYFLGFSSPQIEMNCLQYNDFWKKLKDRLLYAWNESKKSKKKKSRKKIEEAPKETAYEFNDARYNLEMLKADLQKAFVKNLTMTSIVYNYDNFIRIIGRDEFGIRTQIIIYPCLIEGNNFKFFINRKKGFYSINFEKRTELFIDKTSRVGDVFVKMIKIFNTLFRNSARTYIMPNQIFIESLLYNTPDELFDGENIYDTFIKIVNFLNMTDINDFKSILDPNLTISQDKTTKNNQMIFLRFLRNLRDMN